MKLLSPRKNTFETVLVDLTHRCNMMCANCYIPNRHVPDMDIDQLEACLRQFPFRTNIRLAGAEPTMRSDLPDIIARVTRLGHRAVLLTNGVRLARESYVSELRNAGLRHVYISLNGADNDSWYERIDYLRCADKKMAAVKNVIDSRMILNTGTILVRDVNEAAVGRILAMMNSMKPRHALLRFKNVGALGRYDLGAEQQNLTMTEMEALIAAEMRCDPTELSSFNVINGRVETNTRLFPIRHNSHFGQGIWVKLTDWQVNDAGLVDPNSTRRGRITPDFQIAPFFEHVKENEGGY